MAGEVRTLKFAEGVTVSKPDDITGGTGSGSGEINYITNPDFEVDVSDWSSYKDAAQATPEDGTGGSALTVVINTELITPLRGVQSLQMSKGGVNGQGEGIATDFTVDSPDKNKLLKITFDYKHAAGYTSDEVKVFIYDVDNATLITPDNNSILNIGAASGKHQATFASTDSDDYRLIFHVAGTSTTAYDIDIDNVIVGPGSISQGAIVGSYPLELSNYNAFGTISNEQINANRNGEWITVRGSFQTGTPTGSQARLDLTDLNIDSSKVNLQEVVGRWLRTSSGSNVEINSTAGLAGVLFYNGSGDTDSLYFGRQTTSGDIEANAGDEVSATSQFVHYEFSFPVSEWQGSGTVNLASEDNLSKWIDKTSDYTLTNAPTGTLKVLEKRIDDSVAINMIFEATASDGVASALALTLPSRLNIDNNLIDFTGDGSQIGVGFFTNSGTAEPHLRPFAQDVSNIRFREGGDGGSSAFNGDEVVSGDWVRANLLFPVEEYAGSQNSLIGFTEATHTNLGLVKKAVVAIAEVSTVDTIPDNSNTRVDFDDVELDTHSAITTGASWVFTAPRAGNYMVNLMLGMNSVALATTEFYFARLKTDGGVDIAIGTRTFGNGASIVPTSSLNTISELASGETLYIEALQTSGGNLGTLTGVNARIAISEVI